MKLHRASHLGWCFGVRDAVRDAQQAAASGPVTILGELVHNPAVIENLRQNGVLTRHDPSDVTTERVLITAHGASRQRIQSLKELGLQVSETTCPLVHRAHAALDSLVKAATRSSSANVSTSRSEAFPKTTRAATSCCRRPTSTQ
jgi:4-hydroxy-3-methylbut-2-en-1-yl diphosphate reductase